MSVWFSRTDTGFRGWFQAVRTNGVLRLGATSGSFTFVVVSPDDSGSQEFFVSESQQKSGLYYADIQGSYLLVSGVGDYGVSVELAVPAPQSVTDAFSSILHVTQEDWDSLSGSIWNASSAEFNTSGTMGGSLTEISSTLQILSASGMTLTSASRVDIAETVWDRNLPGEHDAAGTAGKLLQTAGTGGVDVDVLAAAVWDRLASAHTTTGTMGELQNNIEVIRALMENSWELSGSQMVFYGNDGVTPFRIYNLLDTEGDEFFSEPDAPAERILTSSLK